MIRKYKICDATYYFDTKTLRLFKNRIIKRENKVENVLLADSKKLNKLVFNVANTCNLSCIYCYACGGNYGRKNSVMSLETARDIIKKLVQYEEVGIVYFFGGEPTINFHVVKFIVKELNKYFKVNEYRIVTNATLLNDEMISFFAENNFKVYISLDGPSKINNYLRGSNTNKILETINKIKSTKIANKLEIICTYTKFHEENMLFEDLLKFFDRLHVRYSISDVITNNQNLKIKKSIKEMVNQEKKLIDISFCRIETNSLNVGISSYVRSALNAIIYKIPEKVFCHELLYGHSRVFDYNGEEYSCIRLLGTFNAYSPEIATCNNKRREKCEKCWANALCSDCVADVVLKNIRPCYSYSRCYKVELYDYALKAMIKYYDENQEKFNQFVKTYLNNYML